VRHTKVTFLHEHKLGVKSWSFGTILHTFFYYCDSRRQDRHWDIPRWSYGKVGDKNRLSL